MAKGAAIVLAALAMTCFHYGIRPLVIWGHWVPGYPYGNYWHYIPTKYAVRL